MAGFPVVNMYKQSPWWVIFYSSPPIHGISCQETREKDEGLSHPDCLTFCFLAPKMASDLAARRHLPSSNKSNTSRTHHVPNTPSSECSWRVLCGSTIQLSGKQCIYNLSGRVVGGCSIMPLNMFLMYPISRSVILTKWLPRSVAAIVSNTHIPQSYPLICIADVWHSLV